MRHRRDYHKKRLSNPYYPSHKPRHRVRWWFFCALLLITSLVFLSRWDRLKITTITVSGNKFTETAVIESLIEKQLESRRWLVFPQRGSIFFNASAAKRHLIDEYQFATVSINKNNFNSIVITVTEREPVAAAITNGTRYHIDDRGVIIREFNGTALVTETTANGTAVIRSNQDAISVPEIVDQSNTAVTIGKQFVSESTINFISAIHYEFKQRADFEVVRYILKTPSDTEITMVTSDGWEARLNSAEKALSQADAVLTVLNDKVSDMSKLQYIDVRYGDKIFYQ